MILDIFLPEILRGKRLLSKKILGFSFDKNNARMVELLAASSKNSVNAIFEEHIAPTQNEKDRALAISTALKALLQKASKYDYIRVSVPTSIVIFKELKVSLKQAEKIRMVIDYEVEPLLPFPLQEAVLDFIITRQEKDEDFSHVLVAAIRKEDLALVLDIYNQAGIFPTQVTVDLLAFYNLYHYIPDYASLKEGSSIVDVGEESTRVAFLQNGELRLIRNIPKGVDTLLDSIHDETNLTIEAIKQHLVNNGIVSSATDPLDKAIQKHVINFLNDIQFTLNSFSLKLNFYKDIQKILFIGIDGLIKNFTPFASDVLQIPCELFDLKKLFETRNVVLKAKQLPTSLDAYTLAIGTALPPTALQDFDIMRKIMKSTEQRLLTHQIIAAISLVTLMIVTITAHGFFEIKMLSSKSNAIEKKETEALKQLLIVGKKNTRDDALIRQIQKALGDNKLAPLLKKTKNIVTEEERGWIKLAHLKIHALDDLSELSVLFDRKRFNIKVNSITISNDETGMDRMEITGLLKSKVEGEDFQDFAKLEQQLMEKDENKKIILISSDSGLGDEVEGGVKFTLVFKQKEQSL